MSEVQTIVRDFTDAGALVLSPADPRIVGHFGDFVFVASDQVRHLRTVQGRHLAAIAASDFVWLVAPDGYIGQSAAMEVGFAAAHNIPVYSDQVPSDLTLRQWVVTVADPGEALRRNWPSAGRSQAPLTVLLDPAHSVQASHDDLQVVQRGLLGQPSPADTQAAELAITRMRHRLLLP